MKSFDEMLSMSKNELETYREELAEEVIQNAKPSERLKLRSLHAKAKMSRIKSDDVRMQKSNEAMMESFIKLNSLLQDFRGY
jgi:hypothetical protein